MFPVQGFVQKAPAINSYHCPESITSFVTGSAKLLVPGKVTAAASIPQGATTALIEPAQLLGQPDIMQISASLSSFGTIELDGKSKTTWYPDIHWVRALRLSEDCHSQNVQLRLQPSQRPSTNITKIVPTPKLVLQAVRPIEVGHELLLWLSEEVLAMLQIPFLTPANIQGQKKYVCTKCSALYESPNPLKLHISLSCGRSSIKHLWERLTNAMTESSLQSDSKQDFNFKLYPEPQIMRQNNAIDLSLSGEVREQIRAQNFYRPYADSSAFKPFKKTENNYVVHPQPCPETVPMWPIVNFDQHSYQQQMVHEGEAQIETLVSSLGKSKQGHVCLYCGKCYSRKYGLKIHIRTHTGYKPLKCKFCMRPFGDPSNLNKHVRLHAEGNTPYKCELCGKILVRRRDLDRHLKSRHMIETHPDLKIMEEDSTSQETAKAEDDVASKSC